MVGSVGTEKKEQGELQRKDWCDYQTTKSSLQGYKSDCTDNPVFTGLPRVATHGSIAVSMVRAPPSFYRMFDLELAC